MHKAFGLLAVLFFVQLPAQADIREQAEVINVTPRYRIANVPRTECFSEGAVSTQPAGERSVTGAVVGAVAGGLLGSQVGKGKGKVAAAAAGAAAGAITGDRVQNGSSRSVNVPGKKICQTVYEDQEKRDGYDVTYRLGDKVYTDQLSYDPGRSVRVRVSIQ